MFGPWSVTLATEIREVGSSFPEGAAMRVLAGPAAHDDDSMVAAALAEMRRLRLI